MINIQAIKERGEYLGFCDQQGYIYSVVDAYDAYKFYIVALQGNCITRLITFKKENGKHA